MKIANVSWGWTPIPEDTPHGDSLIKLRIRSVSWVLKPSTIWEPRKPGCIFQ